MSTYRRYQEARDTAWRALLRVRDKRLPIDPEALSRDVGMEIVPFPDSGEQPRLWDMVQRAGGGMCVSLRIRGAWHIFLREQGMDDAARRFSVAHELGHLLLGHETYALSPGVRAFRSRENAGDLMEDPDSLEDYAADIFAIRLLAPACLLHEMRIDTPGGIMRACALPPRAAALRAERMEVLNQRDAFFVHPLEKQVRQAFLPFLRAWRASEGMPAAPGDEGLASRAEGKMGEAKESAPAAPRLILPQALGAHEDRTGPQGAGHPRTGRKKKGALGAAALFLGAAALFFLLMKK